MNRYVVPLAAAAIVGAVLPLAVGPTATAADKKPFSGYSATAWAAPVKIELYEPTIPIPASPQLELELAYSKVEADSGSSAGRASWLWPGDPVGEGAKTFGETLGLPPQLFENGYPVQVNASQPSGADTQADEPFPGTVMRTSATEGATTAQVGFSPDGQVSDGTSEGGGSDGGGQDGGEGTPGAPGLPEVPGLPALPGMSGASGATSPTDTLQQLGAAITGKRSASADAPAAGATPTLPGLPPELAALLDVEGYTSSSATTVKDGRVVSTARSALGDVSLLGGLIRLDGVVVTSSSGSNGKAGTPTGRTRIGGITIAGQELAVGPEGFVAAGQRKAVPTLPTQLSGLLDQLGISLELPTPERAAKGDQATSDLSGLRVQIDAGKLRRQLDVLPIDDLVGAVPAQLGQLKSALQAVTGLSPRVVLVLGNASTAVDTVQGIALPTVPAAAPGVPATPDKAAGAARGAATGSTPAGSAPAAAGAAVAAGSAAADGTLDDAALAGSGLPPLYSIPGALLVGGLALGALGGTWLRRAGVLALGGAGSCSHGLDRGLPDLRKVR